MSKLTRLIIGVNSTGDPLVTTSEKAIELEKNFRILDEFNFRDFYSATLCKQAILHNGIMKFVEDNYTTQYGTSDGTDKHLTTIKEAFEQSEELKELRDEINDSKAIE